MDHSDKEFPVIFAQAGELQGQRWILKKELMIGREPDCDIIIPDRQVSRHHARFTLDSKGALVEDLGSKNGTYCNGAQIVEPSSLSDGDLISIAMVHQFTFLSSDATIPIDAARAAQYLAVNGLEMDARSRRVWVNQTELLPPLSAPQFRLLQALYDHPGQVVARNTLIDLTWGEDESAGVSEQAFDALVRRLRDRIAQIDPEHEYIVTIRGHGMRLDNPQKTSP